jgi:hypothetical protein
VCYQGRGRGLPGLVEYGWRVGREKGLASSRIKIHPASRVEGGRVSGRRQGQIRRRGNQLCVCFPAI